MQYFKVCYVHMVLMDFDQETINLIPNIIEMASPLELSQYMIQRWQLVYYDESNIFALLVFT